VGTALADDENVLFCNPGARDGQWGMTFTFFRMFSWSEKDRTWWIK
jgi:hypothetical protein